jgi:5'-nucleotidase
VSANKPAFFEEGTTLREVNLATGQLDVGRITEFKRGHVYNGGSMKIFAQLSGSQGHDVLYVGDHIFSDVIVSKKTQRWRNLLVIRELDRELAIQESSDARETLKHLENLNFVFREIYKHANSASTEVTDISLLRKHIKNTVSALNMRYNEHFGQLFRSGSQNSFFAMQVMRYADMYTADYTNLLNYPCFYYFSAPSNPLPHEAGQEIPMIP